MNDQEYKYTEESVAILTRLMFKLGTMKGIVIGAGITAVAAYTWSKIKLVNQKTK